MTELEMLQEITAGLSDLLTEESEKFDAQSARLKVMHHAIRNIRDDLKKLEQRWG